ncbi:MAG: malonyl-CoA decarboxylase [Geminicoccaceae bacterium]|nr:malonyl-CoA decarboxylase [Geminicoccaceae bacterium]
MRVISLWTSIADAGRELLRGRSSPRRARPETLAADLLSTRGDAVGTALARELVEQLKSVTPEEKVAFLLHLANEMAVDSQKVISAAETYRTQPGPEALQGLRRVAEGPRMELFRRINMAPDGIRALVSLRELLLRHIRENPQLAPVDSDLQELLTGWFNPGFLSLVQIDWNSPASLLEKLMRYEKVHKIPNLEALRRRLAPDRRCFAFFHPALPDEPLIFVQVALVRDMAAKVQSLIETASQPDNPAEADTAIFYSISNCQDGLRGVSLGNFLIKAVVSELTKELPSLRSFATLSPVPGFLAWFRDALAAGILTAADEQLYSRLQQPGWIDDEAFAASAKPRLEALCAHYLVMEKRKSRPRDPVARFHLNNGARLERINWMGDISAKGLDESAGILVNYRYHPAHIERNHEAYANDGAVVASTSVRGMIRPLTERQG